MGYTNSPLVSYTKLSPNNSGQRLHKIDRITPHCVVGQVTAEGLGDYFSKAANQVSSNYGIGYDGRIGMYVEEKNRSWCSSSADNDNRAITIECASDTAEPYTFRDACYASLIDLCIDICQRYGKTKLLWLKDKDITLSYEPAEDEMVLTVHRWFYANKSCPGTWMMNHMSDLAEKVTAALSVQDEDEVAEDINVPTNDEPASDADTDDKPANKTEAPVETYGTQAKNLAGLTNVQIIDTVGPLFTEDQRKTGVLASVSMAQFILESGYCRTELAKNANNCFGMKCNLSGNTWPGSVWNGFAKYRMATDEYKTDGSKYTIFEDFRKYSCVESSIADHSAYLLGAKKGEELRYAGLKGCTDYRTAAQIIKDGGYATAPDYVSVLCQLVEMWGLTKWEYKEPVEEAPQEQDVPDTNNGKITLSKGDYNQLIAWLSDITEWLKDKNK